jgi:hypothetical protein
MRRWKLIHLFGITTVVAVVWAVARWQLEATSARRALVDEFALKGVTFTFADSGAKGDGGFGAWLRSWAGDFLLPEITGANCTETDLTDDDVRRFIRLGTLRHFARPYGTRGCNCATDPSDKSLGYFRSVPPGRRK